MSLEQRQAIIRKLVYDEAGFVEIREHIRHESRYVRAIAVLALTRWINRQAAFDSDSDLIDDLIAVATDSHEHAKLPLPGTYANQRHLAIACLLDLNTDASRNAVNNILSLLQLEKDEVELLNEFLREREQLEFWTGRRINALSNPPADWFALLD